MKIALILVGSLTFFILLITLIGYLLPQNHIASMGANFKLSVGEIWQLVSDVKSDDGVNYEVVESVPPRRLVTRIANKDLPYGGSWTYEIEPIALGARLTITENGEVYNPYFRFMSRFVFGYYSTMDKYFKSLGKQLGNEVVETFKIEP
jgi:hypothetical protein